MPPCQAALLQQHPQLAGVDRATKLTPATVPTWLAAQKRMFGETLDVQPLATWEKRTLDADVADVLARNPSAQILTVNAESGEVA